MRGRRIVAGVLLATACTSTPSPLYGIRPGMGEDEVRQLGGRPDHKYSSDDEHMPAWCVKRGGAKLLVYDFKPRAWEFWKSTVDSRMVICIDRDSRVLHSETEVVTH
jgi:hypothetical protein